MKKVISLKKQLFRQIVVPAIFSIILVIIGYILVEPATKRIMIDNRKQVVMDMVESKYNLLEGLNQKVITGEITLPEAKSIVLDIIRFERYGKFNTNYFWIQDLEGNIIYHPAYDNALKTNKDILSSIYKVASRVSETVNKNEEGFLSYTWYPLQGESTPSQKEAYVKGFRPWGWIIGTGFMINDIQNDLNRLTSKVLWSLATFLGGMLVILTLVLFRNFKNLKRINEAGIELEKSEKRFRRFVEHIDSGLIIYENNIPVFANAQIVTVFGGFCKGLQDFDLEQYLLESEKVRVNQLLEAPSDTHLQFSSWIRPVKGNDRFVGVEIIHDNESNRSYKYMLVKDITEQERLATTLNMLSESLSKSSESVVITDLNGNIEYVNSGFEKNTGYTFKEVKGRNPRVLKSQKMRPVIYKDLWETVSMGNIWEGELLNKKKDGTLFWEATTIFPIKNLQGEIIKYSSIKKDITQSKAIEKQLIEAKEKAEENERLKSAFLGNISHEVRTPLNAVYGFSQLLKTELEAHEKASCYLDLIEQNSVILLKLFDDIIDYSHIESRAVKFEREEIRLNYLVYDIAEELKKQISSSGKRVNVQIPTDPEFRELVMFTDPRRLRQIFNNILSNAIKYTHEGQITISYDLDYEYITFHITDTGIGIPAKEKNQVFETFSHGKNLEVSLHKGVGLGLNTARQLVELFGGVMTFASREGTGSTFSFSLPTFDLKNYTINGEGVQIFLHQVKGLKILIAEDNDDSFKYLETILSNNSLVRAKSGSEVVRMMENVSVFPDIILMDLLMPEMDGISAGRLVKRIKPSIPIIAITAIGSALPEKEKAVFETILEKPVKAQLLLEKIQLFTTRKDLKYKGQNKIS